MSDTPVKPLQPKRPGMATAAGIILIVYCSLSILSGVIGLFSTAITSCAGSMTEMAGSRTPGFTPPAYGAVSDYYRDNLAIVMVFALVNLGAGIVGLVAGIFLMSLKQKAPMVARIYTFIEFGAVVLSIINTVLMLPYTMADLDAVYSSDAFSTSTLPPGFGTTMSAVMQGLVVVTTVIGFVVGIAIPVLILIFVTRPKVTEFYSRYGK